MSTVHTSVADAFQRAESGHPGLPLGVAPWRTCAGRTTEVALALEARATHVGDKGGSIGLDRYGASAPGEVVMDKLGFSAGSVVKRAKALVKRRT